MIEKKDPKNSEKSLLKRKVLSDFNVQWHGVYLSPRSWRWVHILIRESHRNPKPNSRSRSDATWRSSSSAGSISTQSWQVRAPAETKIKGNLKLPKRANHHRIMIVGFWLHVFARRSLYCAWWRRCHSGEERELISCRNWRYRILIKSHIKFSSITTESWSSDSDYMCLLVGLSTVRGGEDVILKKSESLSAVGIEGTESWSNLTSSSVQSLLQHTQ